MAEQNSPDHADTPDALNSLAHDLRHSLYALRTGIQLLAQVRENAPQFQEFHQILEKEVQTATDRLQDLLKLVSNH